MRLTITAMHGHAGAVAPYKACRQGGGVFMFARRQQRTRGAMAGPSLLQFLFEVGGPLPGKASRRCH